MMRHTLLLMALLMPPLAAAWPAPGRPPAREPTAAAAPVRYAGVAAAFPEDNTIKVLLRATPRLEGATGQANVRRRRGVADIEIELKGMQPATKFGGDFNTYVLWAVTPEGLAYNAGELILRDAECKLNTSAPLVAFGMLVTAEPHFLVERPSELIVLESADTGLAGQRGTLGLPLAYEGFQTGYRHERDSIADPVKPEGQLRFDRHQAVVAVRLAELARAQQYAPEVFATARDLLNQTLQGFAQGIKEEQMALFAGRTIQSAAAARRLALERAEQQALAAERRANREEIARLRQRNSELEAAAFRSRQEAESARAAADKAQAELEKVREQMLKANEEADRFARLRAEAEQRAQAAQQRAAALFARMHTALNLVAETRETERGLTVNLPDILFDSGRSTLRPRAKEVLSRIAGILLIAPEYHLSIEGHTDSTGNSALNQRLSERRAQEVEKYLIEAQISPAAITTRGFGESRPVASNRTAAGRQENRRVEIIIEGLTR